MATIRASLIHHQFLHLFPVFGDGFISHWLSEQARPTKPLRIPSLWASYCIGSQSRAALGLVQFGDRFKKQSQHTDMRREAKISEGLVLLAHPQRVG